MQPSSLAAVAGTLRNLSDQHSYRPHLHRKREGRGKRVYPLWEWTNALFGAIGTNRLRKGLAGCAAVNVIHNTLSCGSRLVLHLGLRSAATELVVGMLGPDLSPRADDAANGGFGSDGEDCVTPRVSLDAIYDDFLDSPLTLPVHAMSSESSWVAEFMDGISLNDVFADESEPMVAKQSVTAQKRELLGKVSYDDIVAMHPNKIFCMILEYVLERLATTSLTCRRHKVKGKATWQDCLAKLMVNQLSNIVSVSLTARDRWLAQAEMGTWIARLTGRSVRTVRSEMTKGAYGCRDWSSQSDAVKCRFHFLRLLSKEAVFKEKLPECSGIGRGRSVSFSGAASSAVLADPERHNAVVCYGFLATYNTNVGMHDPAVLQWVQAGLSGDALRERLMQHPLMKSCFDRFVEHHKKVSKNLGFPTWAVAMEHGGHSNHPARVHIHSFAGVDIRNGIGFLGTPKPAAVDRSALQWEACAAPFVKFTVFRRPSPTVIFNAVASGMYYVAGGKTGNMFLDMSIKPFEDPP